MVGVKGQGYKGMRCGLWWCNEKHYSRGYCGRHYQQYRRNGTPLSRRTPEVTIFYEKVEELSLVIQEIILSNGEYEDKDGTTRCLYCGNELMYSGDQHAPECLIETAKHAVAGGVGMKLSTRYKGRTKTEQIPMIEPKPLDTGKIQEAIRKVEMAE